MEYTGKINHRKFKDRVFLRDEYKCIKCKEELPTDELDVHHIVPKSDGGSSSVDNGQTLCKKCHRLLHKSNNTLDEYAFEYKSFNNVDKGFNDYVDDFSDDGGSRKSIEELPDSSEDIDIDSLDEMDKSHDFDEEV